MRMLAVAAVAAASTAVASGAAACMPDAFTAALDGLMVVAAGMLDGYIPGRRHAGAALLA